MSNNIGFTHTMGSLPEGWDGSPQELLNKVAELLSTVFNEDIAVFKTGSTEPDSLTNQAWLKDGIEWRVPDEDGNWVPVTIDERFKYIYIQPDDPFADAAAVEQSLWVVVDTVSTPTDVIALKAYVDGAWKTLFNKTDDIENLTTRVDTVVEAEGGLKDGVVGFSTIDAAAVEQIRKVFLNLTFPVGSSYINHTSGVNPATQMEWPESTWEKVGQGRILIGEGTGTGLTPRTLGDTGGAETVTLEEDETPKHRHSLTTSATPAGDLVHIRVGSGSVAGGALTTSYAGGSAGPANPPSYTAYDKAADAVGHDNMPPFLVAHFWQRTA